MTYYQNNTIPEAEEELTGAISDLIYMKVKPERIRDMVEDAIQKAEERRDDV